jgi:disulfide bond formation protein DsbB
MKAMLPRLVFWSINLWIIAYALVIGISLLLQCVGGELPCPLCMLQRYAMILSTLGAIWIIRQAQRGVLTWDRYVQGLGLGALGAFAGAVFASRQIMLHILPGDQGYGSAVLGLHLYSWAFVTFCVVIVFTALLGVLAPAALPEAPPANSMEARISSAIGIAFLAIVAINAVMIVCLEGFNWVLPDDPAGYALFGH